MADFDFSGYTLPQLFQLQKDVEAQINHRKVSERTDTLAQLRELAQARGFNLDELVGATGGKVKAVKADKKPSEPKYRNPADHSATWSGRGRKPQWILDAVAKGGKLEDFLI
ncbi:H-NS histone family protein [Amantichitinum ursilacus]|uniref:DNA-binding protein StpA n=1 Tax=Amantichitinum ursilacus TaxID=857265 RepID=A0A0N0XIC5_9NEIS|nr:H-NS histone family protein [Amantichitinum ursilacus]KPC50530.1 DNA-binding protein StpA [Amantichitinum ursilacus]